MRFWYCLLFGAWLLVIPVQAIELAGYYENDVVGVLKKDGGLAAGNLGRLRLKIDSRLNPGLAFHVEPRCYLLIKSQNLSLVGVTGLDQLIWDRIYLKGYSPLANLTVGKQRIAWGAGYVWNPTDAFNPFVMSFAVREEDETNVEAVRIEMPMGEAGGVDGYVLIGNKWEETKKGIRAKTNVGLFDLSFSYVDLGRSSFQLGFDSAGEVFGVGVRNEFVLKAPASTNRYFQSVWGWDYTLENGTGLNMEYFFNGLGKKNREDYDWTASQKGMDYLFFGVNRILDELTSLRGSLIVNLDDLSWIIYPQYTRNVKQNLDLSLEAMLLGGPEGSEFVPPTAQDPLGFGGSKMVMVRLICNF